MNVSLAQLLERVRQATDSENSERFSDEEVTGYLNLEVGALHDVLVQEHEQYCTTYSDLSLTGSVYALGSGTFKVVGVDRISGSDAIPLQVVSLREHRYSSRSQFDPFAGPLPTYCIVGDSIRFAPSSPAPGAVRLWYVPTAPTLVSGSFETLAGPYTTNGWEEYVVLGAAIMCLQKDDRDAQQLQQKQLMILQRIKAAASARDLSGDERIEHVDRWDDWW